jgi:5-methylcytosine-specific restriction endonuclease McrA
MNRPLKRHEQSKLDGAFRRAWKNEARAEQKCRCAYCAEPLTPKTATADHVQARAAFGLDHRNNIVAACEPCNRLKGHLPVAEFRRRIERPRSGEPIAFWLAWFRRRLNLRLDLMAKNLGVA